MSGAMFRNLRQEQRSTPTAKNVTQRMAKIQRHPGHTNVTIQLRLNVYGGRRNWASP